MSQYRLFAARLTSDGRTTGVGASGFGVHSDLEKAPHPQTFPKPSPVSAGAASSETPVVDEANPKSDFDAVAIKAAYLHTADTDAHDPSPNPEERAGYLQKLFFGWMSPMYALGRVKPLEESDLIKLSKQDTAASVSERVQAAWKVEKQRTLKKAQDEKTNPPKKPSAAQTEGRDHRVSVGRVLIRTFGRAFFIAGVWKFFNDLLGFTTPIVLNYFLKVLEDTDNEKYSVWFGYFMAGILYLNLQVKSFVENHYFHKVNRVSLQVRSAVTTMVYQKALRLSAAAKSTTTTGQIVNLMQLDATKLSVLIIQLHVMWSGLFQICGYMAQLFVYVGPSALAGLCCMPLLVILQGRIVAKSTQLRKKQMAQTDERVKQTNELIQGVRAVKMYGWEEGFFERIQKIRETGELVLLRTVSILNSLNMAFISAAPNLILVATFFFYTVVAKEEMSASTVFTVIAVFNNLRFPIIFYPAIISQWAEARVSTRRLTAFMSLDDVETADGDWTIGEADQAQEAAQNAKGNKDDNSKDDDGSVRIEMDVFSSSKTDTIETAVADPAESGHRPNVDLNDPNLAVAVSRASFWWDNTTPSLVDLTFSVPKGSLVADIGPVGSGKSSLCMALLHEMRLKQGKMKVHGSIAYVAQSAWILNTSLRENIRFGMEFDEQRYRETLRVCALEKDIEVLPNGDKTEIGERGINLSGGQKQRVSIARAAYADRDVYIFDDPLSALDSEVSRTVFENCIMGVLGNKTRVLVTNQLHFLRHADYIVVLDSKRVAIPGASKRAAPSDFASPAKPKAKKPAANGASSDKDKAKSSGKAEALPEKPSTPAEEDDGLVTVGYIKECGTFDQLMGRGLDFASLMKRHGAGADEEHEGAAALVAEKAKASATANALPEGPSGVADEKKQVVAVETKSSSEKAAPCAAAAPDPPKKPVATGTLTSEEERSVGAVNASVYWDFVKSSHSWFVPTAMVVSLIGSQFLTFASGWWIAYWANQTRDYNTVSPPPGLGYYLGIYAGLAVGFAILSFTRMWYTCALGLRASASLHKELLQSVLNAPTYFFDVTPVGRIVARFSKDLYEIDNNLVSAAVFTLNSVAVVIASIVVISAVTPWFAVCLLPLGLLYTYIMNYFRATSRELKRLDSLTRSPVYAHFSATLGGLPTIRAYAVQDRFGHEDEELIDRNHRPNYLMRIGERWLTVRLEILGNLIVLAAGMFAILGRGTLSAGLAGLSLSYAMGITSTLSWAVRSIADLENQMNAVERVLYYSRNIPQEKARDTPKDVLLSEEWPTNGEIQFNSLQIKYRPELDVVLKGLTCFVRKGEKVGVVGRTGSGKSTLMLALLRLVEPFAGNIVIDHQPTEKLGLKDLRTRVSIIPQDSVLFSGTVRFNLDPLGHATDEQLWDALTKIHLKDVIWNLKGRLDHPVSEYGENFSAGQRQLLCLGRAIVRRSRILLLDEATSSIDFETDQLVQQLIRTEFAHCTILTIAHRINTIIDADRILVLRDGNIAEFDHPAVLLADPCSHFYHMVQQTGPATSQSLIRQASQALSSRQNSSAIAPHLTIAELEEPESSGQKKEADADN